MIVDVHAHGLSEDFIIETAKGPGRDWKVEIAGLRHYVAADYGPLDPTRVNPLAPNPRVRAREGAALAARARRWCATAPRFKQLR
jgi:hypothetical protein